MLQRGMLLGHYHLKKLIGNSQNEVYQAEDVNLRNVIVALKVSQKSIASFSKEEDIERAISEFKKQSKHQAEIVRQLRNEHILEIYEYGEATIDGIIYTYLAMPYIEEGSLQEWFAAHTSEIKPLLSLRDINDIIQMAAKALQYAHRQGVIHSDVKPPNFLVESKDGHLHILLSDFGIARITNADSTSKRDGTAPYMPPEQWDGTPTEKSDQYALAITAYQLLTGHCPFEGNYIQLQYQHKNVTPDPPSQFNHSLTSATDNVILRALAKKPEDRYPSIKVFADAFQEAIYRQAKPINISLVITSSEAKKGTNKSVQLPDGTYLAVSVPRKAKNGQTIHVDRKDKSHQYGPKEIITITLTVIPDETKAYSPNFQLHSLPAIDIPYRSQKKILFGFIALALILILMATIVTNTNPVVKWIYYKYVILPNATVTARANATATYYAKQTAIVRLTATANANASATAGVLQTAIATTPTVADPLISDIQNTPVANWQGSDGSDSSCRFDSNGYHVTTNGITQQECSNTHYDNPHNNFTITVDMAMESNDSSGGLAFDVQSNGTGYFFEVSPNKQEFKFSILNCNINCDLLGWSKHLPDKIHNGHNTNNLEVIVKGNYFSLWINGFHLADYPDKNYNFSNGYLSLVCYDTKEQGKIEFSNLYIHP